MSIKSKRITTRIFATFLILSLTLCYFTIGVSASDYSESNDTVYVGADYWGLEELPFGVDTGVVQFQYEQGYLTLFFDELSIYDNYDKYFDNETYSFVYDHYWSAYWDNSSGAWDYKINIMSDSPIYYKKAYFENGVFSSSIGTLTTETVWYSTIGVEGGSVVEGLDFPVYLLEDYSVNSLVSGWTLGSSASSRSVYSNCYQISQRTINGYPYYIPARAGGASATPTNLNQIGYLVKYYPSVEYLQNVSMRDSILTEFFRVQTELIDIYQQMYNANVYLEQMYYLLYDVDTFVVGMHSLLDSYLPLLNYNLGEILEKLDEIKTGPEYDSSQGIGSNTEFGDSVGGLIGNTDVPDSGIGSIKNDLQSSFLAIRTIFDSIVFDWFPLGYVITFLLGLSFIAYVLGRVIKNKMR